MSFDDSKERCVRFGKPQAGAHVGAKIVGSLGAVYVAAYAAKLTPDSIVGAVTSRLSASRASIVPLRIANFT